MTHATCLAVTGFHAPSEAWRLPGRPGVLTASLAAAAATLCLSGAALVYAFTHVPEVDPDAEAAPAAAAAAAAPIARTRLEVLTPPIYGPDIVNIAPAVPFVPVSAHVKMDSVDLAKLAEADGVVPPCADPCIAQAGYIVPDESGETRPAAARRDPVIRDDTAPGDVTDDEDAADDDGNAPPPPDMAIN